MGQTYPTGIPSYPDTTGGEKLGNAGGVGLSRIIDDYGLDITGATTKIGTGASTPVDNAFLVGNGVGTSSWESASTAKATIGLSNVDNTSDATKLASALSSVYPVGCIYSSTVSTNPATVFGFGTWVAFGEGKVLVGKASAGTFNTAGATGGAETHTLDVTQIPSHQHNVGYSDGNWTHTASAGAQQYIIYYAPPNVLTTATGGGLSHNNLQPYVVVYYFTRTA